MASYSYDFEYFLHVQISIISQSLQFTLYTSFVFSHSFFTYVARGVIKSFLPPKAAEKRERRSWESQKGCEQADSIVMLSRSEASRHPARQTLRCGSG